MEMIQVVLTTPANVETVLTTTTDEHILNAITTYANELNMGIRENWAFYKNADGTTLTIRDLY